MQEAGAYGSRGTRRDFGEQAAVLTCPPVHQPQTPCRKTPATHACVWWISQHGCPHDPRTHGMTPARMTCTGTRLTIECREVSPFLWRVWAVAARFTRAADCWLRHRPRSGGGGGAGLVVTISLRVTTPPEVTCEHASDTFSNPHVFCTRP